MGVHDAVRGGTSLTTVVDVLSHSKFFNNLFVRNSIKLRLAHEVQGVVLSACKHDSNAPATGPE